MQINRNNYEEFFLLYVDNELSAAEKNAVDVFLQDNPDLQEELLMLQQSVVKPDAVVFDGKQKLMINDGITENLQEKLLLYLDNEANKTDTAFVQQLIQTDDAVKKEWDILQQTKLDAGTAIVFKDKHLLYKKETGKVVGFRWWRVAAAAVLIGFGIWGAVTYSAKNNNTAELVKNNTVKENSKSAETIAPKESQPAAIDPAPVIAVNKEQQSKQNIDIKPQNKKLQTVIKEEKNIAAAEQENKEADILKTRLQKLNSSESNNTAITSVTPEKQENNIAALMKTTKESNNELQDVNETATNNFAIQTSFTETGDNEPGDFTEDNDRKGRTKVGAFFKKVKRMVERKTNAKNSDNSIKIASLSFAVQ